jgi:hypothetical protein
MRSNPQDIQDSALLPRDPETGEPLAPTPQPGYYPGYSTLSQKSFWEEKTRDVVTERVDEPPPRRFFSEEEWRFWEVVFEHLIPQSDRTPERRIPLIPTLDKRLHENHTVGYRFENMPQDRDAYRLGLEAINAEAQACYAADFLSLGALNRDKVMRAIHDAQPKGAPEIWKRMSVHRFFQLILSDAIDAYYAHPWAWDEIGFGGPAYPRAYTRLERGEPEPWEVEEQRYDWDAPPTSVSDEVHAVSHHHTESEQSSHVHPVRPE